MMRPLAIDLFTGLHGWAEGLVAEGFDVVGFDIEDMCGKFGVPRPAHVHLVVQDVLLRVRGKAHTAIASRVWGYQVMLDLGCDKLDIIDQINGDLDIFRDLDGRLRRALDELGLLRDEELDLSGLEALKGRLDAETTI
jgi:hypothetical protein